MNSPSQLVLGSLRELPEIANLIGEFMVRWSLAESVLIMPMLVAMNSSNQEVAAAILASTNSTEGKIRLVKTAIGHVKKAQHQKLKKPIINSLNKLLALCEERNSLCHHLWAVRSPDQAAITIDYRKAEDAPGRITARSESYLRDLCNRVLEAAFAICDATKSPWITAKAVEEFRL